MVDLIKNKNLCLSRLLIKVKFHKRELPPKSLQIMSYVKIQIVHQLKLTPLVQYLLQGKKHFQKAYLQLKEI